MHPLIGSAAAAAQEPLTLAGAPTPLFHPLNSLTGYRGMCFRFLFFFFFLVFQKKDLPLWSQVCFQGPLLQDTLKTVIIISTPIICFLN